MDRVEEYLFEDTNPNFPSKEIVVMLPEISTAAQYNLQTINSLPSYISPLLSTHTCETRHDQNVKIVRNNYTQRPLSNSDALYNLELIYKDLSVSAHGIYFTLLDSSFA